MPDDPAPSSVGDLLDLEVELTSLEKVGGKREAPWGVRVWEHMYITPDVFLHSYGGGVCSPTNETRLKLMH